MTSRLVCPLFFKNFFCRLTAICGTLFYVFPEPRHACIYERRLFMLTSDSARKQLTLAVTAGSLCFLLLLFLLSGLVSLGQQLQGISPWLGTFYTILVLFCLFAGIVWPIASVWRRPIFSMYLLRDRQGHARKYWCHKLTANLKRNVSLTEEESASLDKFLRQGDQTDDLLIDFFCTRFSPVIDSRIKTAAKAAFVSTAISQTALYDMLSMLSINLQQIRSIVESCGYRPSGVALLGLYVRILKATFLAGGMEEMDLEELLPLVTGNAVLKLPGLVLASAAQGTVNAFTTIRVGIITKKILFAADGPVSMADARRESYREALNVLKKSGLLKDFVSMLGKKAAAAGEAAAGSVRKSWNGFRKADSANN